MMFYIILEIPNTVLKEKIKRNYTIWKIVNLLANLAAKSSIFLLRTYTLRPPLRQLKKYFLNYFWFLYGVKFLKCAYLFIYLQKWPTYKHFLKNSGLALAFFDGEPWFGSTQYPMEDWVFAQQIFFYNAIKLLQLFLSN